MRVAITGGAGFIGRAVVARLVERGDEVTALVRDPARAKHLRQANVRLVTSDLSDRAAVADQLRGADALIHAAGDYRIGIRPAERQAMWDANVGVSERVLDAAIDAGVTRVIYVSTANVYGNTHGQAVDERYRRDLSEGFVSWYDETKFRAHEAAEKRQADGAPIVIVLPGGTYGPNDHSLVGEQLQLAYAGKLQFVAFSTAGVAWSYVDDVASGIVASVDRGRLGESYVLAGECRRFGESMRLAARLGGHRPPRLTVPNAMLRLVAPINDRLVRLPGLPVNLAETIRSSDNVTYWAKHDKATAELGFEPRSFAQGVVDTWGRVGGTGPSPASPADEPAQTVE